MAQVQLFQPGFRLIDGNDLNAIFNGSVAVPAMNIQTFVQGAVTNLTAGVTLTAAQLLSGILNSVPGTAANANYQLPTVASLLTALPNAGVNSSFNFSLVDTSTVSAETATLTTNTGWTLVGNMVVQSNNAATNNSVGQFRAVITSVANATATLYRVG